MHVHALVLDGVFAKDRTGAVVFHSMRSLSALDVAEVLATEVPVPTPARAPPRVLADSAVLDFGA